MNIYDLITKSGKTLLDVTTNATNKKVVKKINKKAKKSKSKKRKVEIKETTKEIQKEKFGEDTSLSRSKKVSYQDRIMERLNKANQQKNKGYVEQYTKDALNYQNKLNDERNKVRTTVATNVLFKNGGKATHHVFDYLEEKRLDKLNGTKNVKEKNDYLKHQLYGSNKKEMKAQKELLRSLDYSEMFHNRNSKTVNKEFTTLKKSEDFIKHHANILGVDFNFLSKEEFSKLSLNDKNTEVNYMYLMSQQLQTKTNFSSKRNEEYIKRKLSRKEELTNTLNKYGKDYTSFNSSNTYHANEADIDKFLQLNRTKPLLDKLSNMVAVDDANLSNQIKELYRINKLDLYKDGNEEVIKKLNGFKGYTLNEFTKSLDEKMGTNTNEYLNKARDNKESGSSLEKSFNKLYNEEYKQELDDVEDAINKDKEKREEMLDDLNNKINDRKENLKKQEERAKEYSEEFDNEINEILDMSNEDITSEETFERLKNILEKTFGDNEDTKEVVDALSGQYQQTNLSNDVLNNDIFAILDGELEDNLRDMIKDLLSTSENNQLFNLSDNIEDDRLYKKYLSEIKKINKEESDMKEYAEKTSLQEKIYPTSVMENGDYQIELTSGTYRLRMMMDELFKKASGTKNHDFIYETIQTIMKELNMSKADFIEMMDEMNRQGKLSDFEREVLRNSDSKHRFDSDDEKISIGNVEVTGQVIGVANELANYLLENALTFMKAKGDLEFLAINVEETERKTPKKQSRSYVRKNR